MKLGGINFVQILVVAIWKIRLEKETEAVKWTNVLVIKYENRIPQRVQRYSIHKK